MLTFECLPLFFSIFLNGKKLMMLSEAHATRVRSVRYDGAWRALRCRTAVVDFNNADASAIVRPREQGGVKARR